MTRLLLCFSLCCALVFPSTAMTAEKKIVIKVASYHAPSHPVIQSFEFFKENLERESKGAFDVQIYPNSQLGAEELIIDHIKRGTVQIGVSGSLIKKDEPRLAMIDLPMVIETWKQAYAVYMGPLLQEMAGDYTKKTGVNIFGCMVNGFRVVSSSIPLNSFEDLSKMKLRVPNTEVFVRLFQSFGTNTVMMPMSEVYNALETKVVHGQENPYPTVKAAGWWEAQKYMLETNHMFSGNPILVNGKFYNSLNAENKALFDKWLKEAIDLNWKLSKEENDASRQFLADKGLTIVVPDAAFRKAMNDALKDFFAWYTQTVPGSAEILAKVAALPRD